MLPYRIGYGEDAHRLEAGRPLMLGGVAVAGAPRGALAHSDGDALLHAVSDALLSSLARGDIGHYFPDTAPENAGLDSRIILARCLALVRERGYRPANLAVVVTLDRPKLDSHRQEIARSLADLLGLGLTEVGLGFKTSEQLAPDHIQTRCTLLLTHDVA